MKFRPVIKWIGSKRSQSAEIVKYFPEHINTYYEPFCGGCSVLYQLLLSEDTKYTSIGRVVCSDINGDLIDFWNTLMKDPKGLFDEYKRMWCEMSECPTRDLKRTYFETVREEFNQTRSPYCFLFLMRTATNGLPRYNKYGQFNNSFHLTREGINPISLKKSLDSWSQIFNEFEVEFRRCDYNDIFDEVQDGDFMYLDPPYLMTRSTGKYFGDLNYENFFDRLRTLGYRGVKWACSFDNEHNGVIVPGDIYENLIMTKGNNCGFRTTVWDMDSENKYGDLYLN